MTRGVELRKTFGRVESEVREYVRVPYHLTQVPYKIDYRVRRLASKALDDKTYVKVQVPYIYYIY